MPLGKLSASSRVKQSTGSMRNAWSSAFESTTLPHLLGLFYYSLHIEIFSWELCIGLTAVMWFHQPVRTNCAAVFAVLCCQDVPWHQLSWYKPHFILAQYILVCRHAPRLRFLWRFATLIKKEGNLGLDKISCWLLELRIKVGKEIMIRFRGSALLRMPSSIFIIC